ncbi:RNA export factor gle2 [Tieghemiomyces parasiticus]|uniref:RNA export factor gle2 n=1 Tax=Tieghemiomyces parasiticus TaxID=78921 RepID=A0A9W8A2C5_9FUNG|nr:RNA export factor gle2 [Tieghemiomyces parasiticus]KAJ1916786.1 RNA export factor gle2 [Tieghemiomyces parasiticus]
MNSVSAVPDVEVSQPPEDSISGLAFSPQADYLSASSWNNEVRIYEVQPNGTTVGKASYSHESPALCTVWSSDGTKVFSGGADNAGRMFDITTGQATQVAQHDNAIRCMRYVQVSGQNVLVTGSWDKTLKYWDTRTPNPVATVTLPERCYTMDAVQQLLVVGTAERRICIYNLANPTVAFQEAQSPLKWQTRVVSCFPDASGYAVGSIEGRIGIQYIDPKNQTNNFTYKCHRDGNDLYSVNDISFHPTYGTYSSAGADGVIFFWDKTSKQRLKTFDKASAPITNTCFNRNGSIFAYAVCYDWSKGHQHAPANSKPKIMLHAVKDEDVKPRPAKKR